MRLYLMRHAEANKTSNEAPNDFDRTLTDLGRSQARAIAEELQRRGVVSPLILCSPYVRTSQTAGILGETLNDGTLVSEEALTSTGHAPDLQSIFDRYPEAQHMIVVGHQPDIGMLVELLVGFEFGLTPAGMIAFEYLPEAGWKHLWNLTPEDLLHK